MPRVYASPFGGAVQAVTLREPDARLDRAVALGELRAVDIPSEHPLAAHVASPEPSNLDGWILDAGGKLFNRRGG